MEEANKTLSLILSRLINPNAVHPDGFTIPSAANTVATTQSTTTVGQFSSVPAPVVTMQSTTTVSQFSCVPAPVVTMQSTTTISQFYSSPAPVVTMQSTTTISQFHSSPAPVVTTQSTTTISQFHSSPAPVVTTQSTPTISQFHSSPAPVVITQSTSISTQPANFELCPQPTPACVHFETVSTTPPPSSLPTAQSSSGLLDVEKIKAARSASCSRRNFSAKIVAELFDEDTRKRSNVAGEFGKLKLNPVLMDYAKSLAFQFYPLEHFESEKTKWVKCVIAIDEFNRRKAKKSLDGQ